MRDPKQDPGGTWEEQRTLQLQTLKSTINSCVADQMDNMPEAVMLPERPGLEQTAEDMTDVVRFVLEQNDYETVHRRRVEDLFITGTAVTQVAWDGDMDQGKGNVAVVRWPVEAFLWDPAAEDIQESRAVMKVSWHPLSWYEAHYPEQAKYVRGEEASCGEMGKTGEGRDPGDEERAMLLEYWWRKYDKRKRRYEVNVAYLAGGALLTYEEKVYGHGKYPFIVDVMTAVEGQPAGEGMVQELAPMMRYVNRYARYIDENLRMSSKNRALVRRNANLDVSALSDWRRNIIEGDDISPEAVQWFQSKPLNGMAREQMLQFQMDMKQDSGQNQFTRGETVGGVTAASAISALQEAGGKITRLRTGILNQGFKEMVEQIMYLIAEYYDGEQTRLITGRRGKAREVRMSGEYLTGEEGSVGKEGEEEERLPAPPYHVQIEVRRRNPLRVQAQNELYMQAYTMAAQAGERMPVRVLFELMEADGKERVLPELEKAEAEQKILEQAKQVLEENERLREENAALQKFITPEEPALDSEGGLEADTQGMAAIAREGNKNGKGGRVNGDNQGGQG